MNCELIAAVRRCFLNQIGLGTTGSHHHSPNHRHAGQCLIHLGRGDRLGKPGETGERFESGHVDASDSRGVNMPLCNLYVTLLQRFGIERDRFNTSTGTFELRYA